jgi:tetratricopeptide (TPR) repeat protein
MPLDTDDCGRYNGDSNRLRPSPAGTGPHNLREANPCPVCFRPDALPAYPYSEHGNPMTITEAPGAVLPMPLVPRAYLLTGNAFLNMGRLMEALACFDLAAAADPTSAHAWNCKAAALGTLGREQAANRRADAIPHFREAIGCLDRALELNPHHAGAWFNKGLLLAELERDLEAEVCLECAHRHGARGATPALDELKERVSILGRDSAWWLRQGRQMALDGRHEEATICFERAADLNASDGEAWYHQGAIHASEGRMAQAARCFEAALARGHTGAEPALRRCLRLAA